MFIEVQAFDLRTCEILRVKVVACTKLSECWANERHYGTTAKFYCFRVHFLSNL